MPHSLLLTGSSLVTNIASHSLLLRSLSCGHAVRDLGEFPHGSLLVFTVDKLRLVPGLLGQSHILWCVCNSSEPGGGVVPVCVHVCVRVCVS